MSDLGARRDIGWEGVAEIENVFIPMRDGVLLAARLFLPRDVANQPAPAIFEFLPYRKRDLMRSRDEGMHRYFAAHGYVGIRVDCRGSGDSQGLLDDEYSAQEHRDALDLIDWIAQQSWCTGAVGMWGISWGGINALQVAALRPPALRAIMTLCSTDDRYADDAHYMGGCLLNENMQWGSILLMYGAYPPDPELAGATWREQWRRRIDATPAFPDLWMRHPWRDAYWRHGSVCEDYDQIDIPVYAIGGWADAYSNSVFRLVEHLKGPCRGLIGPWAHNFPHDALPGPSIGFLQEAVAWWDRWLKGIENGIEDGPKLRAWMQEGTVPQPQYEERPGRWVAEDSWPSPRIRDQFWYLGVGHLARETEPSAILSLTSPQTTGVRSGEWCAFGADGEMPRDQRPDDGNSLVFDSTPLEERIEILGAAQLTLDVAVDTKVAQVAVRLCDVGPDGSSLRVSYGLLNLCHRDGHDQPTPLTPGTSYKVVVRLNGTAHAFAPGHRVRLAISTSYWPIAWPAPQPVRLTLRTAGCELRLPVRPPRSYDAELPDFATPEMAPSGKSVGLRRLHFSRELKTDLVSNELVQTLVSDGGDLGGMILSHIPEIDLDVGYQMTKRYRIIETDPLSAQTQLHQTALFRRGDWSVRIVCRTHLSATADTFQFTAELEALEDDELFARREWHTAIPRQLA